MIFVTRDQWGSISTNPARLAGALPEVYIHHVAGRLPVGITAEFAHMRQLQQYAIGTKGYADVDYNLIVGASGTVYEGRGIFAKSAATLDRNMVSRSICAMGNYETDVPSDWLLEGIVDAARMMIDAGALAADVVVRGHRDNPAHPLATACPGANLIPHIPGLAARILQTPLPPNPQQEVETVIITNDTADAAYGVALMSKFLLDDDGYKRLLSPDEWEARGSPPGRPCTKENLDRIPTR